MISAASTDLIANITRYLVTFAISIFFVGFFAATAALAQQDDPDSAPPPLKIIPRSEKQQLLGQSDLKGRAKMALAFMEAHLASAEKLSVSDATATFRELGMFEALMEDTLIYLNRNNVGNNKSFDAYKKLEMGLRPFMARIETVRRSLPLECDEYVRKLMTGLRDARAKAIDPMFTDNIVRNNDNP